MTEDAATGNGAKDAGPKGAQTLLRGLDALQCVARGIGEAGGIAKALGVPRSTAHRMLNALVQAGYLHNIPHRGYTLGPELIFLGARAREQQPLIALAQPHLQVLADLTRDTIHFGVPDGSEVLYLSKINGTRGGLEMRSKVGQRMPMAFTGVGKAMLIGLPEQTWRSHYDEACHLQTQHPERVPPRPWNSFLSDLTVSKARGCAFDLEENELGIRCIAAPVYDRAGDVAAAVSVASALSFMPEQRMSELVPDVIGTARAISKALGWRENDE